MLKLHIHNVGTPSACSVLLRRLLSAYEVPDFLQFRQGGCNLTLASRKSPCLLHTNSRYEVLQHISNLRRNAPETFGL